MVVAPALLLKSTHFKRSVELASVILPLLITFPATVNPISVGLTIVIPSSDNVLPESTVRFPAI